ncbi:Macrocin O-methyltransferase [Fundidesulfovibrio magnetotacticus]|uniref:Macrocin O-methyltransferase n=1 Tax=Fundidesulfovibrio magnetotacticus TaxID=2730080 RepID=A0A6V8LZ61_9BACT|nr:TylF/MycF/NovP-related O-methyltransferase [Fundidesulfovibrio magnetotacticus]GFK95518.1 Macrocin O-methyltransferase [Fundidesulfovibrio magnetotacticus]
MISDEEREALARLYLASRRNARSAYLAAQMAYLAASPLADSCEPRTMWEPAKVRFVLDMVLRTESVPGNILELGVFQGGGTFLMARMLKAISSGRVIVGVDSFEGMPEPVDQDADDSGVARFHEGMFREGSSYQYTSLLARVLHLEDRVRFIKGYFADVLPSLAREGRRYSLAIVDPDQYAGTMQALETFYDLMSPGGVVIVDDYGCASSMGVQRAVDEFLAGRPERLEVGALSMVWFRKL